MGPPDPRVGVWVFFLDPDPPGPFFKDSDP